MKQIHFLVLVSILVCLDPATLCAKDKPGKSKAPGSAEPAAVEDVSRSKSQTLEPSHEPWVSAKVVINDDERRVIRDYVHNYSAPGNPGKKSRQLPPGLAKKVARGEKLPPGWQKKCCPGQIMPVEVFGKTHPLPPELVVKLPPPPPDTITVTVSGKVVRLAKATREILDVFNVHVGRI